MYFEKFVSHISFKLFVLVFILWGNSSYAPITKSGFYCDDESIKHPYHGDSIHFLVLLTVSLILFPYFMYLTELLLRKAVHENELSKIQFQYFLRNYFSGFLFVLGFTEFLKLMFSELRPHFISTCIPDMQNIKCSTGYISNYNCTGKVQGYLGGRDAYKSFPSGHASLSVYSFIFINMYIFSRTKNILTTSMLLKCWRQTIPIITFIWTVICCVSRILDHRHFWWDVLAGICIGIFGGFVSVKVSLNATFQRQNIPNNK